MRGKRLMFGLAVAAVLLLLGSSPAVSGSSRGVLRGAAKGAAKGVAKRLAKRAPKAVAKRVSPAAAKGYRAKLRWDLVRDRATRASALKQSRTVFRYVPRRRFAAEMRRGIGPGRHFTSRVHRGRPLSAINAKRRYGLPKPPAWRMKVRLPKGQSVKFNKVVGSNKAGVGEIISTKRVPRSAIKKAIRLRQGRSFTPRRSRR